MTRTKKALEEEIRKHGFDLRYVDYCESADTPGVLGYYRGVTSQSKKYVKVALKARNDAGELPTEEDIIDVLEHELHHVVDPDWTCGSQPVTSTKLSAIINEQGVEPIKSLADCALSDPDPVDSSEFADFLKTTRSGS